MCTLTYIPVGENDFFFTANRDESPQRPASQPQKHNILGAEAIFPKDKTANGTWVLCHEKRFSLCLLNGAFQKHEHKPPYRKSRGKVLLELTEYFSAVDFVYAYDFIDIEPFTIIVLNYQAGLRLEEVRWDGSSAHYRELGADRAWIWSSPTLYGFDERKTRESWFDQWLGKNELSQRSVLDFHRNAGKGDDYNALVMNRKEKVKTLSITQIRKEGTKVLMHHEDLSKDEASEIWF